MTFGRLIPFLLVAFPALAAQVTDVATAMDDELQHDRTLDQIDFRVAIGLYRGLELHVFAPYVLRDAQDWDYATVNGVSVAPTSPPANNTISISGCGNPANCSTVQPIV